MSYHFRHSICNEIYQDQPFADACRSMKAIGYEGIEIAPFTLAEDPAKLPAAKRKEHASTIQSEGLQFAGLHWLMVAPKGLHVTTPDKALREKSWLHIRNLIDLCADLAGSQEDKGVMIFGSPQQRCSTGGMSPADATRNFVEGLAGVAPHAEERGVTILVEALPRAQCDIVLSLDEAVRIVNEINSPAVRTMFDTHNAIDEVVSHGDLVDRHFEMIRHVHVNEMDGRHPGTSDYNFLPLLKTLRKREYQGWVSLEAFDFSPGAERIASESLRYLQTQINKLNS